MIIGTSKGRVLLVDDEPLVLEMFESALAQEGFDVFVAGTSKEAIRQLEKSYFDVLVCDVMLEELDGFDVMTIAKRRRPDIAVLLITGAPSEEDAARANLEGASYLSKPIGADSLIRSIVSACNMDLARASAA